MDAGLPKGCLNILHVERGETPGVTKGLIEDKRIRHVNFVSVEGGGFFTPVSLRFHFRIWLNVWHHRTAPGSKRKIDLLTLRIPHFV